MPDTVRTALARALDALGGLQERGEDIDDEWIYVNDLAAAWRSRLEAVIDARGDEFLPDVRAGAIDQAIDEVRLITDPHRAIDWMSTFPQVVLLAVDERPGGSRTRRRTHGPSCTRRSRASRSSPARRACSPTPRTTSACLREP